VGVHLSRRSLDLGNLNPGETRGDQRVIYNPGVRTVGFTNLTLSAQSLSKGPGSQNQVDSLSMKGIYCCVVCQIF
jgi:hypothetical protein